jgi:hypothetical protein
MSLVTSGPNINAPAVPPFAGDVDPLQPQRNPATSIGMLNFSVRNIDRFIGFSPEVINEGFCIRSNRVSALLHEFRYVNKLSWSQSSTRARSSSCWT